MKIDEYPLVLKAEHVAEILNVSRATAYNYMRRLDFPSFKFHGSIRVMRDSLYAWMIEQSEKGA